MAKKLFLNFSCILIIVFAALVFVPYGGQKGIVLKIKPGLSAGAVASQLEENGVVLSPTLFRGVVALRGAGRRLQAGTYQMPGRESLWLVVSSLVDGRAGLVRVMIPEGFASQQIGERLERAGLCGADEFLSKVRENKSEGFLFPQTYFLRPGMKAGDIISLMAAEFEKNWRKSFSTLPMPEGLDKRGVVTLASIVEREARADFERPEVAAVFLNRLHKRWLLESCATVQYALGWWKPQLSYADLKVKSPYNTYVHPGLPPGPVCSPGLASLKAVFFPAETEALFFVADGRGTHSFFTTYKEHEAEKRKRKKQLSAPSPQSSPPEGRGRY